ncbi:MAG: tetratricopeptide repeat protein [Anaerolineae bacterium]|nr:tetratricopeptide repeat protein [Anaerolineae bacterium]
MILQDRQPNFRKSSPRSNPYKAILLLVFILAGLFVLRSFQSGEIEPFFQPTPIPTRTAGNYTLQGETFFIAGDLQKAIDSYDQALLLEPDNAEMWAELARIQAYSSSTMTTDSQRLERMQTALASADRAIEIDPSSSYAHAVRAFVLNWYASASFDKTTRDSSQLEAEREAIAALTLDNRNTLALAYYAEIQADQSLILQAQQNIEEALNRNEEVMDVYRVYGYVLESMGYYGDAIDAYKRAADLMPNLTFLYIRIGVNYRQLQNYDMALEYFAKAATINEQNGVQDPLPYLAIGKTYSQMGEFFIAARNVEKVLEYDPSNPDIYGTLGIIYFKARNYEGSIPALQCATYGCSAEVSCAVRFCDEETEPDIVIPPTPLTDTTVVYYYSYASVLAGMHRPGLGYCTQAVEVFDDVTEVYRNEPVIMSIIDESRLICSSFGFN